MTHNKTTNSPHTIKLKPLLNNFIDWTLLEISYQFQSNSLKPPKPHYKLEPISVQTTLACDENSATYCYNQDETKQNYSEQHIEKYYYNENEEVKFQNTAFLKPVS